MSMPAALDARRTIDDSVASVRANPLESLLMFVAFAAIGCAMVLTAMVAMTGDRSQDLTFGGATDELSRTLSAGGTGRVGRLDRAVVVIGRDTVVADTIAINADSAVEPAFARGGFAHDQAVLFNDHALRQAVLGSTQGSRWLRNGSEGPSLFRSIASEGGDRRLSDRPNPYSISIRSPYAEDSWRPVHTADWRSTPAVLGFQGEIGLQVMAVGGVPRQSRVHLNGRECEVRAEPPRHLVYCGSILAADVGRFYDFGFEIAAGGIGGQFSAAFPYRPRDIWVNGRSESFARRAVVGGDVLDVRALGPFVLSAADWGTLADEQWINGRTTFANQRLGTLGFFARAGRSTPSPTATLDPLVLGFDAALAADVDREASRFLAANEGTLARMAVVILDVRSGEVRAIAEPARASEDDALLSFEPILVGSVVKPILAAAILSRHPELGDMRLSYGGDTVDAIAGMTLRKGGGFANSRNGCGDDIDFNAFLRCSSNQYAAELVLRSLQRDGFEAGVAPGQIVPRRALEISSIATGLAQAFDVDAYAERTRGRLPLFWTPESTSANGIVSVSPTPTDRSLIPWESRPWILFPDSSGTRVDWLARYAFGGWENRWTLLGVAQSFARIATDKNVQATFIHRSPTIPPTPRFSAVTPSVSSAFARVRGGLREVGVNGTASGLSAKLQDAAGQPVIVLAKTGTLNENATRGSRDLVLKSLAIAMGTSAGGVTSAPIDCGLVAVSYFEFRKTWNRESGRASLPRIHLEFAEGPFARVIGRHWNRISGCARASASAGASAGKGGR
jgi:hypothetical protein